MSMDRITQACIKAINEHPAQGQLAIDAVLASFLDKCKSMEWKVESLTDDHIIIQATQATDRVAHDSGFIAERLYPVDLQAQSTTKITSIAITMHGYKGASGVGLTQGLQVARLAAAIDECLRAKRSRSPELKKDRKMQRASQVMFKQGLAALVFNGVKLQDLSDTAILKTCDEIFALNERKIQKAIGA